MKKELIKKKLKNSKSIRQEIDSEIEELFSLTTPEKLFQTDASDIDRSKIYDTTAKAAMNTLTTSVLANFVPIGKEWVKFQQSNKNIKVMGKSNQILQVLQEENDIFFAELNKSNFYLAMAEFIENLAQTGTCTMGLEWRDERLNFVVCPWHKIYISEGCNRKVSDTFKVSKLTAFNIKTLWSNPDEPYGTAFEQMLETNPDHKYEVIEYFTELPEWHSEYNSERPHYYAVYLVCDNEWTKLESMNTRESRMITGRWSFRTNSPYGVGPGHEARPDIITINKMVKSFYEGSEYRAKPPIFTSDENLMNSRIEAGKFVYTDDPNARVFQFTDIAALQNDIQALQAQIKRSFHDTTLPPVQDSHGMTATEVSVRQAEFFRSLGHTAVTLEEEILKPVVKSVVSILQDQGIMQDQPYGPDEDADFEFFSVVRAGKDKESVMNDIQALQTIAIAGEEIIGATVDVQGLARNILERLDFSAEFIKTDEQIEADKAQQMNAQAAGAVANTLMPQNANTNSDVVQQLMGMMS